MEEFKPVVFTLGDRKFGIDISKIQGIEKEQNIVPVPNTEKYIIGIMNLRGEVIPVYSLKNKFNIQTVSKEQPQYIITWIKNNTIALEVDGVEEIQAVDESMLHSVPSIIGKGDTGYMQSIVYNGRDLVIIINSDGLLTDEELERVDNMVKSQN